MTEVSDYMSPGKGVRSRTGKHRPKYEHEVPERLSRGWDRNSDIVC
jgi:hypothetical protein